jgi:sulfate transport system ATP-binding protein
VIINRGIVEQNGTVDEVVEAPANPFVMSFFGTVNTFRDRHDGKRAVYARPHEVEICETPAAGTHAATIDEIRAVGAVVRIVALAADGTPIHIELSREQADRLGLRKGQVIHAQPRTPRAFHEELSRVD